MPRLGVLVFVLILVAAPVQACSIPVFRYALENWAASRYELFLFHRGPLSKDERQRLLEVQAATKGANVRLTECDLTQQLDPTNKAIWDRDGKGLSLPHLLLRYPDTKPTMPSIWAAPLHAEGATLLGNSPAQTQLFKALTTGNAGAILLLLSDDQAQDDAARAFLNREVPKIALRLVLPKRSDEGPQIKSDLPLLVAFPVIEVKRDAANDLLVRQLLNSEEDLAQVKSPIAFPVFGRGRALCSLHGKDLEKPAELERALDFLCRACSCQVKELNPGIDLLIHGDWSNIFDEHRHVHVELGPPPRVFEPVKKGEKRPTTPEHPGIPDMRAGPPEGYLTGEARPNSAGHTTTPGTTKLAFVGGAIVLVLLSLYCVYRSRRSPSPPTT